MSESKIVDGKYPVITTWVEYDAAKADYMNARDETNTYAIMYAIEAWQHRKLAESRWRDENPSPFHNVVVSGKITI